MQGAHFLGGPYDGAEFTFSQRMPDRIVIEIECFNNDPDDPEFREAFFANCEGEPALEQRPIIRNAKSLVAEYALDADEDNTPLYKYIGRSIGGVVSSDAGGAQGRDSLR